MNKNFCLSSRGGKVVLPDRSVSGLEAMVDFCENFGSKKARNCLIYVSGQWSTFVRTATNILAQ